MTDVIVAIGASRFGQAIARRVGGGIEQARAAFDAPDVPGPRASGPAAEQRSARM